MHIPRDIRKKLESSLPSYVLDFLTEKFVEAEKYCQKSEMLEQENQFLHQQVHKMLSSFMQQQQNQQGQNQPMGYSQHAGMNYGPSSHYDPYEWDEFEFEGRRGSRNEFMARRGVPGSYYMRRGVPGSRMRNDASGGSSSSSAAGGTGGTGGTGSGGSGSGSSGAGGASSSLYIPDIERPYRRVLPMYEQPITKQGENAEEIIP